jgi:hypothetical protein
VGEIGTHFGNKMERKRESVEDGGNERGGAAESFGDNEVVMEEDVVAVIANDDSTVWNGFGICNHNYDDDEFVL